MHLSNKKLDKYADLIDIRREIELLKDFDLGILKEKRINASKFCIIINLGHKICIKPIFLKKIIYNG